MSEAFRPPSRFPRLMLKVNAFLLTAALLLAGVVWLVAHKQGWFIQQTTIHFATPDALGITKGMPVKLYGFTIGTVSEMALAQGGVLVHLSIINDYMPRITAGSRARFARESGVIGASVIEIIPGKGVPLAEHAVIDFERSRGISEIVEEFRRQAAPALAELKNTFGQINRSTEDVNVAMRLLRAEIERLPQTHDAVRKLVENADQSTTQFSRQAITALDSVRRAADHLERATPLISGKLATTLDSINGAAAQLRQTGEEAQDALRRTRPMLDRGETAAREASEVFGAAKRVWPLADAFKDSPDATLPIDSFEANRTALK